MKTKRLACIALLLSACFIKAKAQTDTTKIDSAYMAHPKTPAIADSDVYDLGRITLQKKFTQAVTIKASALEKMPFTNLSDAISVYYNGIYDYGNQTYVFVVDGNLNTDVNAYSIYDIDEISIIQNSVSSLNGALPNQVLVLVKTKKHLKGKSGIFINGQTNLVRPYQSQSADYSSNTTTKDYYHQYYLSGYINKKTISAGISASFQRSVSPAYKANTELELAYFDDFENYKFNRFRFNAYLDLKINANNTLGLTGGYVPQRDITHYQLDIVHAQHQKFISQNLWYSNIILKTNIINGLTNKLSAGFQRRQTDAQRYAISQKPHIDSVAAINSYLVKDELSYRLQIGEFTINPVVNITYRQAKDTATRIDNAVTSANHTDRYLRKQKLVMLTPSLTVNYADFVMVQGGVQKITFTNELTFTGYTIPTILPFGSVSLDVLRPLSVADSDVKLLVFSSFARTMAYAGDEYGTLAEHTNLHGWGGPVREATSNTINPYQTYDQLQGGVTLSVLKNMLSFSYNLTVQQFYTRKHIFDQSPPFTDTSKTINARVDVHRVGANFVMPTQGSFKWSAYVTGAMFTKEAPATDSLTSELLRYYYPGTSLFTYGFANQFAYKGWSAGVDFQYGVNKILRHRFLASEIYYDADGNPHYPNTMEKINNFQLRNVYIGYKVPLKVKKIKSLEVYVNGRNLYEKGQQQITVNFIEDRKFIGAGFKLGL